MNHGNPWRLRHGAAMACALQDRKPSGPKRSAIRCSQMVKCAGARASSLCRSGKASQRHSHTSPGSGRGRSRAMPTNTWSYSCSISCRHRLAVKKGRHRLQRATQAQLFLQAPHSGSTRFFVGTRMPATAVAPQAGRVVFAQRTLLQQHLALRVEKEDRERPVQHALAVGIHLLDGVQRAVFGVHRDQKLIHEGLQK